MVDYVRTPLYLPTDLAHRLNIAAIALGEHGRPLSRNAVIRLALEQFLAAQSLSLDPVKKGAPEAE